MAINRTVLSGYLTKDAELRSTAGGTEVLNFTVASNERIKDKQTGEYTDYPNFVGCTMFGSRAGKLAQYLSKGTKVCVEGRLHYSSWEKDGFWKSKIEIIVDQLELMTKSEKPKASQDAYSDDIPF